LNDVYRERLPVEATGGKQVDRAVVGDAALVRAVRLHHPDLLVAAAVVGDEADLGGRDAAPSGEALDDVVGDDAGERHELAAIGSRADVAEQPTPRSVPDAEAHLQLRLHHAQLLHEALRADRAPVLARHRGRPVARDLGLDERLGFTWMMTLAKSSPR
jgi:hypothetical protein